MNKLQNIISLSLHWVNGWVVERTKNIFYPSQYTANTRTYTKRVYEDDDDTHVW